MSDAPPVQYLVVTNDEGQYSMLRVGISVPAGWHETAFTGSEEACMEYVDQVWVDGP